MAYYYFCSVEPLQRKVWVVFKIRIPCMSCEEGFSIILNKSLQPREPCLSGS